MSAPVKREMVPFGVSEPNEGVAAARRTTRWFRIQYLSRAAAKHYRWAIRF